MSMLMSTADTLRRLYLAVTSVIVYVCSRLFTSLHIVFRGFIFHPLLPVTINYNMLGLWSKKWNSDGLASLRFP